MDAVKFLKERKRMCKHLYCAGCQAYQDGCAMDKLEPEKAVAIVKKWADENPAKTRLQDFLEKYPKAHLCKNGFPPFRPAALGYCGESICSNCKILDVDCWNMPLEE